MSKTQLQKLRDAAALAYEAAIEVTEKTTDAEIDLLNKITDYYSDPVHISELDVLIGKADEP